MTLSRRRFLTTAAVASLGFPALVRARNLNSRLQVVAVGCDGKGFDDIKEIGSHPAVRFVGFCDVDAGRFRHADAAYPGVPHHADFRAMFAQLGDGFDAAIVSTPDHMHALPALTAMRLKKHVYLQKPLAHSIEEARWLRLEAARHGVRTQMGNQIHSRSEYRTAVRLIQEGRIGQVTATHSWLTNKGNGYTKLTTRPAPGPVPAGLAWDLWLGVAAARPYAPTVYHPFNWRDWQDFGSGTLGDFGCHLLDPIFTALKLGAPTEVQAESTGMHPETWCEQETVRWRFPATPFTVAAGVTLHWYDGGRLPDLALARLPAGRGLPANGSIIVGEKGALVLPHVGMPALYPEETFGVNLSPGELARRRRRLDAGEKDDRVVAAIQPLDHRNHYHDWVDAASAGHETTANFAYAGPLTEAVLLGTIAARFSGQRLEWDAPGLRIPNHAGADGFVRKAYRDGWKP
jgi:predicted dehydrogenase